MAMTIKRLPAIRSTLQPSNHPYLTGAWTPQYEEVNAYDLEVIEGAIPEDLDGIYLRNTENQIHQPLGKYHPFDGDGMIHQIDFRRGKAHYRNRFVRSRCFQAEQEAGGSLWGGLQDKPSLSRRPGFGAHGSLKDSASTDIIVHAGQAIATFYQCGEGYVMDPETLENGQKSSVGRPRSAATFRLAPAVGPEGSPRPLGTPKWTQTDPK